MPDRRALEIFFQSCRQFKGKKIIPRQQGGDFLYIDGRLIQFEIHDQITDAERRFIAEDLGGIIDIIQDA